ncbi:PIGMENT DEFECTIVE 337 [Hibiscus trionum]|uniref:PIGMENT DEFECTIVE 337 n=1 Tax=Hibiscus trionum TaxID=183268 RepID=A0A9W7I6A4_HIBTR|nr:PIGMENT DEFECTIVE 337 [Hibiscus trionum]
MNGVRPSPLKINKESHLIQKPSSSADQRQRRQGLVIIYTHSPKIIHTQARDFMALVQRLTGLSRPDRQVNENTAAVLPSRPRDNNNSNRREDNESSSAITDETVGDVSNNNICSSSNVPTTASVGAMNPFFADMPLFTPGSTDFFCSPRPVHKFGDTGTLNSPTLLEFMKGLPDY